MLKKKVLYIISDVEKSLAFEWIAERISDDFQLTFLLLGQQGTTLSKELRARNVDVYEIPLKSKFNLLSVFLRMCLILRRFKPDVIHTHLYMANMLGLTAGWLLRIPQRIMTRHHAMIHYKEFPKGRKWDVWCNNRATHVVAISRSIHNILVNYDGVPVEKITIIPHGFDLSYFHSPTDISVRQLREKYGVDNEGPVVGVIARYIHWKGIQYVIPAFEQILKSYPNATLVLANALGPYSEHIKENLQKLPNSKYREIVFEKDLASLYKLFDVYVHVPIDGESEAFGQTYVEALAAGVPSVFTLSGIAPEFIQHEYNALVVPFKDTEAIAASVSRILEDGLLRKQLIENGKKSVEDYSIEKMIHNLEVLYGT
jgi:glycosyltransferase involved in cell wall biosynthesis